MLWRRLRAQRLRDHEAAALNRGAAPSYRRTGTLVANAFAHGRPARGIHTASFGVGLLVGREIAVAHGGMLGVRFDQVVDGDVDGDLGTTFTLPLPRA